LLRRVTAEKESCKLTNGADMLSRQIAKEAGCYRLLLLNWMLKRLRMMLRLLATKVGC